MIIETTYGKVLGKKENGVYVWKGIPYAQAPIGSLRFREPHPPEKWSHTKECTEFGPIAYQPSLEIMNFLGTNSTNMSEDCLKLNIWSPNIDNKKRPVLVWIHGGAFISGSGSSPIYDGSTFASNGDLVVVTFNYRLGILGFLHLAELGGEEYSISGNCGILDQIAALQWVKDNIAAFGGDPDQVTIFGESAGAMSIGTLLATPKAKGLFSKAILQSGAANHVLPSNKATKNAEFLLSVLNINKDEIKRLEQLPVEQLVEASTKLPMMSLIPVIDGVVLPKHPKELLKEGSASHIPILIGTNKDEYRLFTFFDLTWKKKDAKEIEKIFELTFGKRWSAIAEHFGNNEGELNQVLYEQLMTTMTFSSPAHQMAEFQVKNDAPVWMYRFDWESRAFAGQLKSCHALEIPFVWNTINKPGINHLTGDSPDRNAIASIMHYAWIAFAHSGNPNTTDLPDWPKYELENRSTMIFDTFCKVTNDPDCDTRIKWENIINS